MTNFMRDGRDVKVGNFWGGASFKVQESKYECNETL